MGAIGRDREVGSRFTGDREVESRFTVHQPGQKKKQTMKRAGSSFGAIVEASFVVVGCICRSS
jgi:hypothetical protein